MKEIGKYIGIFVIKTIDYIVSNIVSAWEPKICFLLVCLFFFFLQEVVK